MRLKLIRDEFLAEDDCVKLSRMSVAGIERMCRKYGHKSVRLDITVRTMLENGIEVPPRLHAKATRCRWIHLELHILRNKRNGLGYYA